MLTYELLFGHSAFVDRNQDKMFTAIRQNAPTFPRDTDPDVVSFISALLEKDPDNRANFDRIRYHPFFAGLDFVKVLKMEYTPEFIPPAPKSGLQDNFGSAAREAPMDSLASAAVGPTSAFEGFTKIWAMDELDESDPAEVDDDDLPPPSEI
jgi:serine/threonine protein kinase